MWMRVGVSFCLVLTTQTFGMARGIVQPKMSAPKPVVTVSVSLQGTVQAVSSGQIVMLVDPPTKKGRNQPKGTWTIASHSETKIVVSGEATVDYLRAGRAVQFYAQVDGKQVPDKIKELTIVTPSKKLKAGVFAADESLAKSKGQDAANLSAVGLTASKVVGRLGRQQGDKWPVPRRCPHAANRVGHAAENQGLPERRALDLRRRSPQRDRDHGQRAVGQLPGRRGGRDAQTTLERPAAESQRRRWQAGRRRVEQGQERTRQDRSGRRRATHQGLSGLALPTSPDYSRRVGQGRAWSWWGSQTDKWLFHASSQLERVISDRSPTRVTACSTHPIPETPSPVKGWLLASLSLVCLLSRVEDRATQGCDPSAA